MNPFLTHRCRSIIRVGATSIAGMVVVAAFAQGPLRGEVSDSDLDGDGVIDMLDVCHGFDDYVDTDVDGIPDGCDTEDCWDALDNDGDGDIDCDDGECSPLMHCTDSDGDGVMDDMDVCEGYDDNADADTNGMPDGCDQENCWDAMDNDGDGDIDCNDSDCSSEMHCMDSDSDGVSDDMDVCSGFDDSADEDLDGVPDGCDTVDDTGDPMDIDPYPYPDPDSSSSEESSSESSEQSSEESSSESTESSESSLAMDTDGDGVPDENDVCEGFDDHGPNSDDDQYPNDCDPCPLDAGNDLDDDGVCGDEDVCEGGDDTQDENGDGVPDSCEECGGGGARTADLLSARRCQRVQVWVGCTCYLKDNHGNSMYKTKNNSTGVCSNHRIEKGKPWFGRPCSVYNGDTPLFGGGSYFNSSCNLQVTHVEYQGCHNRNEWRVVEIDD